MVVGPVKLNTAGNPGAEKTDKRGLDNVLTVEEIIVVLLIVSCENLAADFGKNGKLDVIVFDYDSFILTVMLFLCRSLDNNCVRIGVAGETLMNTVLYAFAGTFAASALRSVL